MKITDEWVKKELSRMCDQYLIDDIDEYPDDERDGRSDVEFFADEVSYMVSLYHEDEHDWNYDLKEARQLLRETKNGKVIPISASTFKPKPGYEPHRVEWAKSVVREYGVLERELKKLQKMGYYGEWYQI